MWPVDVLGPAADASDNIDGHEIKMSIYDCVRTAITSVGDERAVFFVFFDFTFTLNDGLEGNNLRLESLTRKRRRDGVQT